jgi:prolyl oligopeptidase
MSPPLNLIRTICMGAVFAASAASQPSFAAPAGVDHLQWLEKADDPRALAWAREQTGATVKALSNSPDYPAVMAGLQATVKSNTPLAHIILLGPRALRLQRDASHPHGQLQVSTRLKDGAPGPWSTVLDVQALNEKEGKQYELRLESIGSAGKTCLSPAYRYCLLSLAPNGGDEVELREFDLLKGRFVDQGFRSPASRTQAVWLDADRVLVAHALGSSVKTTGGWGGAVRLWQRGTPVETAPIVYSAKPTDTILVLDRIGEGRAAKGVISRVIDYSTFEFHLFEPDRGVRMVALPNRLKPFGLQASTQRYLAVQLAEAQTVNGVSVPAETLLSYDTDAATAPEKRVEIITAPQPGEYLPLLGSGLIAGTRDGIMLTLKRGLNTSVQFASRGAKGWQVREILPAAPGLSLTFDSADGAGTDAIIRSQGFLSPPTLRLIHPDATSRPVESAPAAFDASRMLVETRQARSKDGTLIDYYLVRPRDIAPGAFTPTLETGYGAFGFTQTPDYLGYTSGGEGMKLWLERGGALAVAAIRGGGDRGEEWHRAGIRELRQNSWDDFAAVAQDLIDKRFTRPQKLGIFGSSSGGLLVAATGTQRPELFGAVVSDAPIIDMLRYTKLAMGAIGVEDYGDPKDPAMAAVLKAYSPLHTVKQGVKYPPFLFTVATSDNRVGPGHARKMVARMQELGATAYLYENPEGGHGVSDALTRPELMSLRMMFFIDTLMRPAP